MRFSACSTLVLQALSGGVLWVRVDGEGSSHRAGLPSVKRQKEAKEDERDSRGGEPGGWVSDAAQGH